MHPTSTIWKKESTHIPLHQFPLFRTSVSGHHPAVAPAATPSVDETEEEVPPSCLATQDLRGAPAGEHAAYISCRRTDAQPKEAPTEVCRATRVRSKEPGQRLFQIFRVSSSEQRSRHGYCILLGLGLFFSTKSRRGPRSRRS